jgi:hypothetical protein
MARDRTLSLLQVATVLEIKQERRSERRRAALREVRRMEKRQGERYLHRRGREYVVSVRALENLQRDGEVTLTGIEHSVAELAQIQRVMRRQIQSHGSRIKNLEEWRALTTRYIADCSTLNEPGTRQDRSRAGG